MIKHTKKHIALLLLTGLALGSCTQKVYKLTGANAVNMTAEGTRNPVLKRIDVNQVLKVQVTVPTGHAAVDYTVLEGLLFGKTLSLIDKIEVYQSKDNEGFNKATRIGAITPKGNAFSVPINASLAPGQHTLWLSVNVKPEADANAVVEMKATKLIDAKATSYLLRQANFSSNAVGYGLRKAKDDGSVSYRIPGMVTTDKGTLISVYDIRWDNSADLPANIDVGMNRSTDGGKTWSAMQAIMDMGEPHKNNGVGDPAILFDPVTKTIWVTALWSKGNKSIAGSGPGLSPDETGQFVMTYSKDDGLTWSKPYSITPQVKNPEWRLYFPGPGSGIAMADGKIVFASQYWDANKMPHSTLVYSDDHGKTWKSGVGAKSNTTEAQLVETTPGTIMLNMRDNRGKFRSVATTTDMGQHWTTHATSYNTLTDPVCMASIIKANVMVKGVMKEVLFFSNANVPKGPRKDITIKASLDLGETWQDANQLLLDERECFGYSSLSKIDDHTIGILYEGVNSLHFLRVPVANIIK